MRIVSFALLTVLLGALSGVTFFYPHVIHTYLSSVCLYVLLKEGRARTSSLILPCMWGCVVGHQDGPRFSVSIKTRKASFAEVAAEVVACNPDARDTHGALTVETLMNNVCGGGSGG
jgi:hypothetical protein